jgi:hypothetical protein
MQLRKYDLLYSLNQLKFNKFFFFSKLNNILKKILEKNIEYNIINLKSIIFNTDIFTDILSIKIKKKRPFSFKKNVLSFLTNVYLPETNTIKERGLVRNNIDLFQNKYQDLRLISNVNNNYPFDQFLKNLYLNKGDNNLKKIHNKVFNSIHYKNIGGIRIELKGRLTKRYRADRSIDFLK